MNFGICEAAKDPPVGSFTTGDSLAAFKGADEVGQPSSRRCDAIVRQIHPSKDVVIELRHSTCACVCVCVCSYTRSGHALNSYLSPEIRLGRLLGGYSSADRKEQHAQSEVGTTHYIDIFSFGFFWCFT